MVPGQENENKTHRVSQYEQQLLKQTIQGMLCLPYIQTEPGTN